MATETSNDTVTYTGSAGSRREAQGVVILAGGGGGGGGGGDASAINQTRTQAAPGSNSSVATNVQGVDGGKPVGVAGQVVSGDQAWAVGERREMPISPDGRVKVGLSAATNIAPAAAPVGNLNALLMAVKYFAARPTFSDGWTGAAQVNATGDLYTTNTAIGAPADASATTDSGAFSLIALFKRSLGYLATLATAANKPTAGTNLSGTVTATSGGFNLAADATRKPGDVQGQNIGTVNIGFNEFGGTAAIGSPGTYTVAPGQTFSITTNQLVNFIAASGTAPVTITKLV